MTERVSKAVRESQVTLQQLMQPEHANGLGKVHGGVIMKMVDEAGGICAMRHAQRPCVTVAIDSMTFHSPVNVGELVCCEAMVIRVGRTSIEVSVRVVAENLMTGQQTHTNSACLVFVALDETGTPYHVPSLRIETEEERKRWVQAEQRQQQRLALRRPSAPPPPTPIT